MKKILFLLICLIFVFFATACENKKKDLFQLKELNGWKTEEVYEFLFKAKYKWSTVYGSRYTHPAYKFKYAIFYGDDCIGYEFETEEEAIMAAEYNNSIFYSFCHKGKYAFPARLPSFVFFYDEEEILGSKDEGYWIEEDGEKTLLIIGENHPVIDGVITIDGYERISALVLGGTIENGFKKVVIGDSVRILYYGAITGKKFDEIVFSKNLKEIHGCITSKNNTTFKTIIPKTIEIVGKYSFSGGNIYCEQESKPLNWHPEFAVENAKVYWAGEWEYDKDGNPQPKIEKTPEKNDDNIIET
jgi:hypothetical protein